MQYSSKQLYLSSCFFLAIYGLFWLVGGLLYTYGGSHVVFPLRTFLNESSITIQQFFNQSKPFSGIYILVFSLFALADISLCLIGTFFYYIFRDNYKAAPIMLCLLIAGIFGTIVDIFLLTYWHIIATAFPNTLSESLVIFWNMLGAIEYFTIWLSAAGFALGSLGFYLIYSAAKEKQCFSPAWRYLTLFSSILAGLSVIGIIYSLSGGSSLVIGILFFLATVIVSPLWSFWTIYEFNKYTKGS